MMLPTPRRRRLGAVLAVAVAATLSACFGDSCDGSPTETPPPPPPLTHEPAPLPPAPMREIVFAAQDDSTQLDVFGMHPDGTGVVQITNRIADEAPISVGSGGQAILEGVVDSASHYVAILNADGTNRRTVKIAGYGDLYYPRISRDGSFFVFAYVVSSNEYGIGRANVDGTGVRSLVTLSGVIYAAAVSPDGTQIAFANGPGGYSPTDLLLLKANGDVVRLVSGTVQVSSISWAPGGSIVYFTAGSPSGHDGEIYSVTADGKTVAQITHTLDDETDVDVSPDGKWLIAQGGTHFYLMGADGSNRKDITPAGVSGIFFPRWRANPSVAPQLTRVTVTPPSSTVDVGQTQSFTATALDQDGQPMSGAGSPTWSSSDPSVATIDAAGTAKALKAGSTTISATIAGKSGSATLTVEASVASVEVSPDSVSLAVGGSQAFTATPLDAAGQPLSGRAAATWASSDPSVATISASGVVQAQKAGAATITATIEGHSGTARVVVTPAGTSYAGTLYPGNRVTLKRLASGGIDTLTEVVFAGDHEPTGDKELEGFVHYDLSAIPAGAQVSAANLSVSQDPNGPPGDPFSLGALYVERATAEVLEETAVPSDAIVVANSTIETPVTVDVAPLIRAAIAAGQTDLILRFRFEKLQNDNGQFDLGLFNPAEIQLTYTK